MDNICKDPGPRFNTKAIFPGIWWWWDRLIFIMEIPILIRRTSDHDDVIKWKHFPRYWSFVRGIHRSPVRSFDVFFDLRLNKWLSKHSRGWWFETQSRSLWRHCNMKTIQHWCMKRLGTEQKKTVITCTFVEPGLFGNVCHIWNTPSITKFPRIGYSINRESL